MKIQRFMVLERIALAVVLSGWCASVHSQSPYGLAARQTIPFVIVQQDDRGAVWGTEVSIHNPGSLPITVNPTFFFFPPQLGQVSCAAQTIGPGATLGMEVQTLCAGPLFLPFTPIAGRLEISSLTQVGSGEPEEPGSRVFLANARVKRLGKTRFNVEGFPQGYLSGNKRFAAVTGLKSGQVNGSQWQTTCYAAALNEPVPVFVRLVDGNGQPIGAFASAALDPIVLGTEAMSLPDVFAAVNAPPGNYSNVTALFSTAVQGGQGGAGIVAFCRVVDATLDAEAFEVAKYLDNNDEARQHNTSVTQTSYRAPFGIVSQIDPDEMFASSNLHVAYFQHPDRITCTVRFLPNNLSFFDVGQMRLIDPDGNVVSGGPHAQSFSINLREKSVHHDGQNGRWLIEVAPDRAVKQGGGLQKGGLQLTEYELTCSSGNGHNQLDFTGHCMLPCQKAGKGNELLCAFVTPFQGTKPWPNGCFY